MTNDETVPIPRADPALAATFQALWPTLGLALAGTQVRASLRPRKPSASVLTIETAKTHASPSQMGVSIGTLPRLSVAHAASSEEARTRGHLSPQTPDIVVSGVLGEGGMGKVMLARQRSLERDVALKTVKHGQEPAFADALVAEGMITGHLEHPNIVPVHALGLDDGGLPLLVMKRVTGVPWSELLSDPAHPSWQRVPTLSEDRLPKHVEILMQVAQAVSYAHSKGVLHRDIKPDNVMVGEFGEVYLVDFGVALRLSPDKEPHRETVGTPTFMAPELIDRSLPLGPPTDVYLLGATLHQVLTGKVRHGGNELYDVMLNAYASEPVRYEEEVPEELAALANLATRRDPAERPPTALAFHHALAEFLLHRSAGLLSRAAAERFEELEAFARTEPGRAIRAGAESRFGYLMALREWPESPQAKTGLTRCLNALLSLELARENLEAARSLLEELGAPSNEDRVRVEELGQRLERRARDAEHLQKLTHDADLGVAKRQRTWMLGLLALLASSITLLMIARRASSGRGADMPTVVTIGFVVLGASVLCVLIFWKALRKNAVNRRMAVLLLSTVALTCAHRVQALLSGASVAATLGQDLLLFAMATAMATLFVNRAWIAGPLIVLAGWMVGSVYPQHIEQVFALSTVAMLANFAFGWSRSKPPSDTR